TAAARGRFRLRVHGSRLSRGPWILCALARDGHRVYSTCRNARWVCWTVCGRSFGTWTTWMAVVVDLCRSRTGDSGAAAAGRNTNPPGTRERIDLGHVCALQ